ncbi:MAG: hypothetical protein N2578_03900 [Bdellovibrionaceae bacterium]|nr:hypothetical protein [Pseudobdellovibrionaceae bacterium]
MSKKLLCVLAIIFGVYLTGEFVVAQTNNELSIPPATQSLLKSTRTKRFSKPVYYDVVDSGLLRFSTPKLQWDVTEDNGKALRLGNVLFTERTFFFALGTLASFAPQLTSVAGSEAQQLHLVMRWPEVLFDHGTLEVISRDGQVIWQYEITSEDREKYKRKISQWVKDLERSGVDKKTLSRGLFKTQFAISNLKGKKAPFFENLDGFRFCLSQTKNHFQTKLCSQRYGVRVSGNTPRMGKVRFEALRRVIVKNEEAGPKGLVEVDPTMPTQFYVDLSSGESFEFMALPTKPEIVDLSDTTKPGILRITGFGTRPTNPSAILNPDNFSRFTHMLGWLPTIGDMRKFWVAAVKVSEPYLYFPGDGGGVFRFDLELSDIPKAAARPHLATDTLAGTYSESAVLRGRKEPNSRVSSTEWSVSEDPDNKSFFTWYFKAPRKAEQNRAFIEIEYEGKKYRAFHEMYRAYANELSARVTGVAGAGNFIFLSEAAYNIWFESLFGWQNSLLSKQRWGSALKVFQSMSGIRTGGDSSSRLAVTTLDFKYRFSPGLWTRDESHGALLSYQQVGFDSINAPMLGVGWFWARSMPKVFDDLFNALPLMSYPKWVDMEFIYYPNSLNRTVELTGCFSLNFHGQVLWKPNFFGEAGFGLKRYSFSDASQSKFATLNTFYGTVGVGFKF